MLEAIRYNLVNIANFRGRESRSAFWPYAAFVLVLATVGMALVMVPELAQTFDRVERFAAEHPELATVQSGPGGQSITIEGYHPELMPDFAAFSVSIGVFSAATVLLLAAAVARRLHDRGRSGAWGLMPIPFLAFAAVMMPRVFTQETFDFALFFLLFLNNLLYLGALAALVVMLAGPSIGRPIRYDEVQGT